MRSFQLLAALGLAALLTGCPTTGKKADPGGKGAVPGVQKDEADTELADGLVKITAIDRSKLPTEGIVTYTVENTSGEHLENLLYYVLFSYPATAEQKDVGLDFDSAATNETPLNLSKGRSKAIPVKSPKWQGKGKSPKVIGTKLAVLKDEFVPTVARLGSDPGTHFMFGALECVGFASDEDMLFTKPPVFWIELENKTKRRVSNLEINVIFMELDGETVAGETGWQSMRSFGPGERKRTDLKLKKVKKVRPDFWVKIRTEDL